MALNVIDISPWQDSLDLLFIDYDGVMIKATEGTSYVSPDCDAKYQQAKAHGKKLATYHFTNFGDPIAEADYYVSNTLGYVRQSIPVLDWEGPNVDRVADALAWLRHVRDRYGYNPAIYMSEYVENNYDWSPVVNENFGLIIAKYSNWELVNHAHDWDMSQAGQQPVCKHWPFYFMWQWTSTGLLNGYTGNLDCNIAYLTPDQWDKYAGVLPPPPPTTTTTTTVPPTTTTTTTVPPESTTTTTTEAPTTPTTSDNPVDTQPGETTPPAPSVTTATTLPVPVQSASILGFIMWFIIKVIRRLQGKGL